MIADALRCEGKAPRLINESSTKFMCFSAVPTPPFNNDQYRVCLFIFIIRRGRHPFASRSGEPYSSIWYEVSPI